jgi:hypothetical protein
LLHSEYYDPFALLKYNADGDIFNNWVSLGFRKKRDLALGVEGNYFRHQIDSKYQKNENTSPKILLVFTKRLDPLTSFGSSLRYFEDKWELRDKTYSSKNRKKVKDFQAEIGVERKLSSEVTLGAILGYDSFKPSKEPEEKISSYVSDSYGIWLSGQTCVEIAKKLKLGLEINFRFKRAEFETPYYYYVRENYYYSSLRFRGIYDLTTKLKVGLFYFDNELFAGFYDPIDVLFSPWSLEFNGRHFGGGCSYQFNKNILAGVEYHLRDSSEPEENNHIWGYKSSSLNLGVEGKLSEVCSIRGGFIRTEMSMNPNYSKRRETWENTLTSGFGYQPYVGNFVLEFSYRYAFKKFKRFLSEKDIKSDGHIFSLSLKKEF